MKGRKPAKRGLYYQGIFIKLVNNNDGFNTSLKLYLGDVKNTLKAYPVSDTRLKSDVILHFGESVFGCSLKTSEVDFGQLDRRWLNNWATKLNMPVEIHKMISQCLLNKMVNKNDKFILDIYKDSIIDYFRENLEPLLRELFVRNEDILKYLVVCFYINDSWYITKI